MALTEGFPVYQQELRDRRLALRTRLHDISVTLANVQIEYQECIKELITTSEELNERWNYHRAVHKAGDDGRCVECPVYDIADLVIGLSQEQIHLRIVE